MAKCNCNDCFNCPYDDCIVEGITPADRKEIRERDNRYYNISTSSGIIHHHKPARARRRYSI